MTSRLARFSALLSTLALAALVSVPAAAHAQTVPVRSEVAPIPVAAPASIPVEPPALATPPTCTAATASRFGGCIGPWVSVAPVVVVIPVAINLRTKVLEAGFQPGLCYGVQVHQEALWGFGVNFCGNLNVGAQTAAFGFTVSFLHGWGQFGYDKGVVGDSNATAPRLLFGLGTAIP